MGVDLGVSSEISSSALAVLRGILVKSLSRENLSLTDQHLLSRKPADRHVSFRDGKDLHQKSFTELREKLQRDQVRNICKKTDKYQF